MIGPNYIKRLQIKTEEDRLDLRTAVSVPGCLWAALLSAFASFPISLYPVSIGLIHEYPSGPFALWMAVAIFGTTIAGTLLYILIALLLRRRITFDRRLDRILIGSREIASLKDVSHVERTPSFLFWCWLVLVLKSGRRLRILQTPELHSSVHVVANKLADFLRVPYKDYGLGNYAEIMQLTFEGDRLEMHPPNEVLARRLSYAVGGVLIAGAFFFAAVIFPRVTGHEMLGSRGLVYIAGFLAIGAHLLFARLFRRRIALDRAQDALLLGRRKLCALNAIDHVGLHMGKNYSYHMSLVLAGGREVPLVYYDSRPPTTVEAASAIAGFLRVPVRNYYEEARAGPPAT